MRQYSCNGGYASRTGANSETEVVEAGMGLTRQIQRDWKTTRRSLASARPEEPNLVTPWSSTRVAGRVSSSVTCPV